MCQIYSLVVPLEPYTNVIDDPVTKSKPELSSTITARNGLACNVDPLILKIRRENKYILISSASQVKWTVGAYRYSAD